MCTLLRPDDVPDGIHFFWLSSYTMTEARAPIILCSLRGRRRRKNGELWKMRNNKTKIKSEWVKMCCFFSLVIKIHGNTQECCFSLSLSHTHSSVLSKQWRCAWNKRMERRKFFFCLFFWIRREKQNYQSQYCCQQCSFESLEDATLFWLLRRKLSIVNELHDAR